MPFYDYKCDKCGTKFEVMHGMNEKPAIKCSSCGSDRTSRVFNIFGTSNSSGGHSHGSGCTSCATGGCSTCGGH
ncbi:MAG: zinc ribbon domain-containing protein [Candidatus Margulisiibacteriota bacterium]